MAFSVEMPALGESVTEGTVTQWLKQEETGLLSLYGIYKSGRVRQ